MSHLNSISLDVILLAGGQGDRFGDSKKTSDATIVDKKPVSKLLVTLCDGESVFKKSVLLLLNALSNASSSLNPSSRFVVVSHPQWQDAYAQEIANIEALKTRPMTWVSGGNTRRASVFKGLHALASEDSDKTPDYVLIHDAARPLCPPELISQLITETIRQKLAGASLGIHSHDTLKRTLADGQITETLNRENLWQVQTPQCFDYQTLYNAHTSIPQDTPVTDDSQLLELLNPLLTLKLLPGHPSNIKITTADDIALANAFLTASVR